MYIYIIQILCVCVCLSSIGGQTAGPIMDQIWHAYADRPGNGSYLNKLAPWMAWKGGPSGATLRSRYLGGATKSFDLPSDRPLTSVDNYFRFTLVAS